MVGTGVVKNMKRLGNMERLQIFKKNMERLHILAALEISNKKSNSPSPTNVILLQHATLVD